MFAHAHLFPAHGNSEADGAFLLCLFVVFSVVFVFMVCSHNQNNLLKCYALTAVLGHSETDEIFRHSICCLL